MSGRDIAMGKEMTTIEEVKEWIQCGLFMKEKNNNLFDSYSLGGRMELEEEDESIGCLPMYEVEQLLQKCARELGM